MILCRLGFHKWGKWWNVNLISSSPLFGIKPHEVGGQKRICKCCNKTQIREL